ncbi:hypothetical protein H4S02_000320 [Coemansia sp. RSA 2611]|nr:hypothetical protein H4S02_000320 [Coemansia sp. RSA 2611]
MFTPYAELIAHALKKESVTRLNKILKRMLNEQTQLGNSACVKPDLMNQCAFMLLTRMLEPEDSMRAMVLDTVAYFSEIDSLARDQTRPGWELRTVAKAVACDLRGEYDIMAQYVAGLVPNDQVGKLAVRVLRSPVISKGLVDKLSERLISTDCARVKLVTAMYCAAAARYPHTAIPPTICDRLSTFYGMLTHTTSPQQQSGVDYARSMTALAHLEATRGNETRLGRILARLSSLTNAAQWPMNALAMAVRKLILRRERDSACRLLQLAANRNHREFIRCLAALQMPEDPMVRRTLVSDELLFRLDLHRRTAKDLSVYNALSMTAFFEPTMAIRIGDGGVRHVIEKYYDSLGSVLEKASEISPAFIDALVSEAGAWSFRLQSAEPAVHLARSLLFGIRSISSLNCDAIMTAYLRILRNFGMLQYTRRALDAAQSSPTRRLLPLSSASVGLETSVHYSDILSTFEATRDTIVAEYLRRGIEPSPECLAILQSHIASCGEHKRSQCLAARTLPLVPPSMTGQYAVGRLAAQAFYEQILFSLAQQPRRMLQLFEHILGHHGVDIPEFCQRIVDQTVCLYLQHKHFTGFGFFPLERQFVRFVSRPRFTAAYLNRMRPRFWALHMFLRRRSYVPRLRLHSKQLRIHKLNTYTLGITAIPSAAKMHAQRIDTDIAPVCAKDVSTALNIYLNSIPRNKLGSEIWSTDWVVKHQTRMVSPVDD